MCLDCDFKGLCFGNNRRSVCRAFKRIRMARSTLVKFLGEYGVSDICESAVKIVGIGYLASISSDACSELGFPGLSGPVSFAGRMEMLAISFPYFRELVSMGAELVK